jgi:hypothetical protein
MNIKGWRFKNYKTSANLIDVIRSFKKFKKQQEWKEFQGFGSIIMLIPKKKSKHMPNVETT